jgi:uncharacterized protein (TIGR00369 family)
MGFGIVEVEEGRAVFAATPTELHYNPIGVVHGGFAATLLDSAMGCAVQSTLPAGVLYTTLEVKVNFARPLTCDTGRVLCTGTIVHRGRTVATAEGRLTAEATGKLLAHASTTCLVIGESAADEPPTLHASGVPSAPEARIAGGASERTTHDKRAVAGWR